MAQAPKCTYLRLDFYKFISAESKKSAQAVELPKVVPFDGKPSKVLSL